MGKTSLLNLLRDESVYNKYNYNQITPIFVLFGIEETLTNWQSFLSSMYEKLNAYADNPAETVKDESNMYQAVQQLVIELQKKYAIFMLMDNFELLTRNPDTPLEFFSFLRSLANAYRLAYITTSRASLQSLCVCQEIGESPFFNIFTNLELKSMTLDECDAMLQMNDIGDKAEQAFAMTGGHPGLLMKYNAWLHQDNKAPEQKASHFYETIESYCTEWFSQLNPDYQDILLKLANQQKIPPDKQYLLETLKRKGYVNSEQKISSLAFNNYLLNQSSKPKTGLFAGLFKRN